MKHYVAWLDNGRVYVVGLDSHRLAMKLDRGARKKSIQVQHVYGTRADLDSVIAANVGGLYQDREVRILDWDEDTEPPSEF